MSSDSTQRVEKLRGNCESWREIGQKDNPSFTNSWVNFNTATHAEAAFYKDKFNRVWLQGTIKNGTVPSDAFTMPAGYIPSAILVYSSVDGAGTPSARIEVDSAGAVSIQAGNNAAITLDGISWRV